MLDVMSNDIMINALRNSGVCSVLVSEEDEEPIIVPTEQQGKVRVCDAVRCGARSAFTVAVNTISNDDYNKTTQYCCAFDPLDGSSNIDCNVSIGTIFGVYEKDDGSAGTTADILRSGDDMICAGYCVYSSAVELVFAFKGGDVHCFCLDPSIGGENASLASVMNTSSLLLA